jgi:hypothetical protein
MKEINFGNVKVIEKRVISIPAKWQAVKGNHKIVVEHKNGFTISCPLEKGVNEYDFPNFKSFESLKKIREIRLERV